MEECRRNTHFYHETTLFRISTGFNYLYVKVPHSRFKEEQDKIVFTGKIVSYFNASLSKNQNKTLILFNFKCTYFTPN